MRMTHVSGPCLLGNTVTGTLALLSLQLGAETLAGILGLAFAAVFVVGASKARTYYK